MIVSMRKDCTEKDVERVIATITEAGLGHGILHGSERTIIGVHGDITLIAPGRIRELPGVEDIVRISKPYKRAAQVVTPAGVLYDQVSIGDAVVGGGKPVVIAGPCSVESETQIFESAHQVKEAGADALRGGVWKYRSSPYSGWEGIGSGGTNNLEAGLKLIVRAAKEVELPVVVEVLSIDSVSLYEDCSVDALQIGEPNSRNTALLNRLRETPLPVIHKRGNSVDVEAFLLWAERMMVDGKRNIILCERGILSANNYTRNTLDIGGIAALRHNLTSLPIVVDASHGTGIRDLVLPATLAGIVAGAAGALVEVHPNPLIAKSDGKQSLFIEQFRGLVEAVHEAAAMTRSLENYHLRSAEFESHYTQRMEEDRKRFFNGQLAGKNN